MSDSEPRSEQPHDTSSTVFSNHEGRLLNDELQLNMDTEHRASLISAGDDVDQLIDVEIQPQPTESENPHSVSELESSADQANAVELSTAFEAAPTLIGEKSAAEVREEMALGFDDTTNQPDFDPSAEQLAPQPSEVYDAATTEQESESRLPWEEAPNTEYAFWDHGSVPPSHTTSGHEEPNASEHPVDLQYEQVEHQHQQEQSHETPVQHEKLPWEAEEYPPQQEQKEPSPSGQVLGFLLEQEQNQLDTSDRDHDSNQADVSAKEGQDLNPMHQSGNDNLLALPWESAPTAEESSSQTAGQEVSLKLPWEVDESASNSALPWEPQGSTADLRVSGSSGSMSRLQSRVESTDSSSIKLYSSVEVIDVSTQNNAKLEKLFSDDDLLLDEEDQPTIGSASGAQASQTSLQQEQNITENEVPSTTLLDNAVPQAESQEDRLKALAFLEDDDILLEDELLEEPVKSNPVASDPAKKHSASATPRYTPSSTTLKYSRSSVPSSVYVAPSIPIQTSVENEEFKRSLERKKSKNDAYDFPTDLISTKVKPAPRGHNKYEAKTTSSASSVASPPPISHSHPIADPRNALSTSSGSLPPKASKPGPIPPAQHKSFFEELPIPMPAVSKPSRAGSYGSTPKSNSSPGFNSANLHPVAPAKTAPPPNPYANIASQQKPAPLSNHQYQPSLKSPVTRQNVPFPPVQGQSPTSIRKHPMNPPIVTTNLPKATSGGSGTSPYVRNAGPYAPSSHNRGHSRTNSLIGGKGKEVNPYAPAIPLVNEVQQAAMGTLPPQGQVSLPTMSASIPIGAAPPLGLLPVNQSFPPAVNNAHPTVPHQTPMRTRNVSNPKTGLYGRAKAQSISKVQNPAALMKRQFPIFNWSASSSVAVLIPASLTSSYHTGVGNVHVRDASKIFKDAESLISFPGPLGKGKSKKKEVERWLESNIQHITSHGGSADELLLNRVLAALVKFDGQTKLQPFAIEVCSILNPTLNYREPVVEPINSIGMIPHGSKLDNAGVNHVFLLIQTGQLERAIDFSARKEDWSIALILASAINQDKFFQIASDFARASFPFSKSNNKVQHLMPLIFKVLSGNAKGVINDFVQVASEGEWISLHWHELVTSLLINQKPAVFDFLFELAKYFSSVSNFVASEICYILSGVSLTLSSNPSEGFSYVGAFTNSALYSEIYEYALQLSSATASNSPHLLFLKLKHAQVLADYGAFSESQRYCDFIDKSLKSTRNSSFTRNSFIEFQKLLVRISETDSNESGWFGSKISKVNLEKMWGQLDKFIGGEEVKDKAENGVFSKFSPSVSRTGSVLDFTAPNYQSSPSMRMDGNKDQFMGSFSGPADRPYPLVRSETSTSKYLPTAGNVNQKPPFTHAQTSLPATRLHVDNGEHGNTPQVNPSSIPNPGPSASRYTPFNGQVTPQNINEPLGFPLPSAKKNASPASKYSPMNHKRAIFPYQNSNGAISSLSLTHNTPSNLLASLNSNPGLEKRPSIGSIASNDHFPDRRFNNQSPSVQSDVSVDYPLEFKPPPRRSSEVSASDNPAPTGIEKISTIQQTTINESGEFETEALDQDATPTGYNPQLFNPNLGAQQLQASNVLEAVGGDPAVAQSRALPQSPSEPSPSHQEAAPIPKNVAAPVHQQYPAQSIEPIGNTSQKEAVIDQPQAYSQYSEMEKSNTQSMEHPEMGVSPHNNIETAKHPTQPVAESSSATESTPSGAPPIGPRKTSKPNPYAPGSSRRKTTTNRYGPPSNGKYVSKEAQPLFVPDVVDQGGQIYGAYGINAPTNVATISSSEASGPQPLTSNLNQDQAGGDKEVAEPSSHPHVGPPTIGKSAYVDDSFEGDIYDDSKLETPEPKAPIMLNTSSPKGKGQLFNPYQPGSPKSTDFGLGATLGDFPIPGSPDLTTRANSVIGGAGGGFFSSRLSQSQQSALYQQYEVQDDTVRDYVPVVDEEDEEEDEEEKVKKQKEQKQKELEKSKKPAPTQPSAASAQRVPHKQGASSQQGWLSGWLSKGNDDKPKPIKAKLGGPNKMFYSEEHQRWFTTDMSIEEQLKASAPPPPPKKKVVAAPVNAVTSQQTLQSPGPPMPNNAPSKLPVAPVSALGSSGTSSARETPSGLGIESSRDGAPPLSSKPASRTSLANAGLDDLLSLGGSTTSVASGRKGKRGARRYQYNMDNK